MAKMVAALYHMGQFRGSLGSSASKSTSKPGSMVIVVPAVVICVSSRDTEGLDALEACGVSAFVSSSWKAYSCRDSDDVAE
jgi:hypothetical protein